MPPSVINRPPIRAPPHKPCGQAASCPQAPSDPLHLGWLLESQGSLARLQVHLGVHRGVQCALPHPVHLNLQGGRQGLHDLPPLGRGDVSTARLRTAIPPSTISTRPLTRAFAKSAKASQPSNPPRDAARVQVDAEGESANQRSTEGVGAGRLARRPPDGLCADRHVAHLCTPPRRRVRQRLSPP